MTDWPVSWDGVAETITLTRTPVGDWNVAALGVRAGVPATARTWGATNTREHFERTGGGRVGFPDDPVLFVEAALSERTVEAPALDGLAAAVSVSVESIDRGRTGGTEWVEWALEPTAVRIDRRRVPITNRGFNAVVEMTVAASRLDVPTYDDATLRERLSFFADVVESAGGEREREALDRLRDLVSF
ncbi:MAG: DUF447 domain-containing protein [Halanaeroarchaeum sp.]